MDPVTASILIGGALNLGGGILGGIGQGKAASQQAEIAREQMGLTREQLGMQRMLATPERQNWRQQQALLAAILPQMRNAQVTPPAGMEAFVPQVSGGVMNVLPQGGFGPETLAFFSPEARMNAERELDMAGLPASLTGVPRTTPITRPGTNHAPPRPSPSANYAGAGYQQPSVVPPAIDGLREEVGFGIGSRRPPLSPSAANNTLLRSLR